MLPSEWKKEIINVKGEVDWVGETSGQLLKDFNMLNLGLKFSDEAGKDYKTLFSDARNIVRHIYNNQYNDFLNLLYRVDLPESYVNSMISSLKGDKLFDTITSEILMREFLKVVNRKRYAL